MDSFSGGDDGEEEWRRVFVRGVGDDVKARVLLERCARHIARRKLMEWIMVVVICWRGMIYMKGRRVSPYYLLAGCLFHAGCKGQ